MIKRLLTAGVACVGFLGTGVSVLSAQMPHAFQSDFINTHDRIWVGSEYWANPMEDWYVKDGRLICRSLKGNRNVHVLTHQLCDQADGFQMSVQVGLLEDGPNGSVGFRIGIHDEINDYRSNCFFGDGIEAVIQTDGRLVVADQTITIEPQIPYGAWDKLHLHLKAEPAGRTHTLLFEVSDAKEDTVYASLSATVPSEKLIGNMALVNNHRNVSDGARFWFQDWKISGRRVAVDKDRQFGPILWAMHTLSNSRNADGYVMKMTAQMPPLGDEDSDTVRLEVKREDTWRAIRDAPIDPDARTATFRIPNWPADRDVPYRLVYETTTTDGRSLRDEWSGRVRRDPVDRPVSLSALTCQFHTGFPYTPLVNNLKTLDPDLLYFSGDQIYEWNGGYGIIRRPADRAILNYLRKWYMFGWAFGDLMRDRPTICLPDDHDVFQGNLWGEGGVPMPGTDTGWTVGYLQPLRAVNAVHRTQTAHHPDLFDPTPTDYGMSVYYGDMVYGRVSFGIISDRQFKSGPHHVHTGDNRPDHLIDPEIDPASLDKPGLTMLGDRQKEFLEHWVTDWRGADMKVLLSGTTFANSATHHGRYDQYLIADIDSGGWPQSARDRVLEIARRGRAFHISGDQHLATLIQHGIDRQRDAIWGFCTPAISVIYQRWWRPDDVGMPFTGRPENGMPHTGEYIDGLGNKIFVAAVANPTDMRLSDRYKQQQLMAAGFGHCVFDTAHRTIEVNCYKFLTDISADAAEAQYTGWPVTLTMRDNDGREPVGYLPEMRSDAIENAVLKLYDADGQLVYAERLQGNSARPWVYEKGVYTAKLGDPDADQWEVLDRYRVR